MAESGFIAPSERMEELFWTYIQRRQEAWYNRFILGLPRDEWSKDIVIQNTRFPNVYRFLDVGTQICAEEILENPYITEVWQMIDHVATYRFFNSWSTYKAIEVLINDAAYGDDDAMLAIGLVLQNMADEKDKLFHPTTQRNLKRTRIGDEGTHVIGIDCAATLLAMYQIAANIEICALSDTGNIRSLSESIGSTPGFGPMVGYTAALDLCIPMARLNGRSMLPRIKQDMWSKPSRQCTDGLAVMGIKGPEQTQCRAMRGLHDKHINALHAMRFQWVRDKNGEAIPLRLCDIERCLAGFGKWHERHVSGNMRLKFQENTERRRAKCVTIPAYGDWVEPWSNRRVTARP